MLFTIGLPISLAFIMFSLGLGLTPPDFARVVRAPRAFLTGAFAQLFLTPIVAFILLKVFQLDASLALGVMILAACPGGVTSNMLTRFAGGDLALSITLTGTTSLLAAITVPFITAFSAQTLMGSTAPVINVTSIAFSMFLITTVPVAIGVLLPYIFPKIIPKLEDFAFKLAIVLFILIVLAAVFTNLKLLWATVGTLGPLLIILSAVLLVLGFAIARLLNLSHEQSVTLGLEAGLQNGVLGITVATIIGGSVIEEITTYALPSGIYSITMYLAALPFILWTRRSVWRATMPN